MLDTRHHGGLVGQVAALVALNHGAADGRTQEGVLAVALAHSPPSGFAAHVHHGAECPADAIGRSLKCRNACRVADGLHVPAHRQCQRDGEDGLVAVNHIHAENQWDAQPALLDGHFLQLADVLDTLHVEESAHFSGLDLVHDIAADRCTGDDVARNGQVELTQLLLQGHLRHEVVHKLVHACVVHALGQTDAQCTMHNAQGEESFHHELRIEY